MVNNSTPPPLSRYQRVKNILNAAQGNRDVSYQGYGRFWELPLAQFLTATIYGVPLIAPSPTGTATCQSASSACACRPNDQSASSACACQSNDQATGCACETPTSAPPRSPGRGAASGLIKGLRGEAPFDGTQFPPLLWGPTATPVSAADIQLIADWIDDGCPEQDEPATAQAAHYHTQRVNLALGYVPHPLTVQPINAHKGSPGQLKVRKNIESLTPDDPDSELAHYYKFSEIVHGRRLVREPNGFSFTGVPISFDETGVWPMIDNPDTQALDPNSRARLLSEEFNQAYANVLNALHTTFNGEPEHIQPAVGLMFSLTVLAESLMQTPTGPASEVNAGPSFQYHPTSTARNTLPKSQILPTKQGETSKSILMKGKGPSN
jgi:hypothetical protein